MQLIFLFPFIVLPVIFAIRIKFCWKNYLAIFIVSFCMGGVLGYSIFDYMSGYGLRNLMALIIFYGSYTAFFVCGLYSLVTHFFKLKIPEIYLAINFGFLIISFALVSIYTLGSGNIFFYYTTYLGIQILPKDIYSAIYDVLLIVGTGFALGVVAFILNIFSRRHK